VTSLSGGQISTERLRGRSTGAGGGPLGAAKTNRHGTGDFAGLVLHVSPCRILPVLEPKLRMGELSDATNRDRPTEPWAPSLELPGGDRSTGRAVLRAGAHELSVRPQLRPAGESPRRLRAMRQVVRAASTGIDSKILITTLARGHIRHPLPLWRRGSSQNGTLMVRWGPLRPEPGLCCYVPSLGGSRSRLKWSRQPFLLATRYGTDLQRSRTVRFRSRESGYASQLPQAKGSTSETEAARTLSPASSAPGPDSYAIGCEAWLAPTPSAWSPHLVPEGLWLEEFRRAGVLDRFVVTVFSSDTSSIKPSRKLFDQA